MIHLMGAKLIARAVDSGQIQCDIDPQDVLDVAVALAWVSQQRDRDESRRERLLRILLGGLRAASSG